MFADFWLWITDLGNSKMVALVIFFTTFVGIIIYVYSSKRRSERFESYRYMPLVDDDEDPRVPGNPTRSDKGEK